jgi:hypothetical protein
VLVVTHMSRRKPVTSTVAPAAPGDPTPGYASDTPPGF